MRCPIDGTELQPTDKNGIEIDFCPRCRGVWLDRNELEKILERSAPLYHAQPGQYPPPQQPGYAPQAPQAPYTPPQPRYQPDPYAQQGHYDPHAHNRKHKKREGFLDDLFDF